MAEKRPKNLDPFWQRLRRKLRWRSGRGWNAHDFARRYQGTDDAWSYRNSPRHQRRADLLMAALPRETFGAALEVGCAEGFLSEYLSARVAHLIACDLSREAISHARENCKGFPQIDFRVADIRHDFPGEELDLCLFSDVLFYLSQREIEATLKEAARRIKPGGFLVMAQEWKDYYSNLTPPSHVLSRLDASADWVLSTDITLHSINGVGYLMIAVYQRTAMSGGPAQGVGFA